MLVAVATLSYSIAAAAFLSLTVLLLTYWKGRLHGESLTIACLLTGLWAATIAYYSTLENPFLLPMHLLEILRNAGWCFFLLRLLGITHQKSGVFSFKVKVSVLAISAIFVLLFIATIYIYLPFNFAHSLMTFVSGTVGRVMLAVVGMLLVEQLLRNTSRDERWAIKFACLGIGGLFAYDFYLYSDAMLFKRVNAEIWAARGLVDALTVPLLAISAARNPQWSLGISLSRRLLFHSVALFGSAIYLLMMAAAGYYLRFFGGSWGTVMQMAFLFGAVVLLAAILFSGTFRSWLKVSISKNFYNYNYDYREEWIRFTRTLSENGPGLGERAVQAIAELVESPGGTLYIHREAGVCESVAYWNMTLKSELEPENAAFCQFLEGKQWVVDLEDYQKSPEKYEGLAIPQWLRNSQRAWLIVPLILHKKLFGFVVLAQPRSGIKLNWEILDLLKITGGQAASYLAQHESANALMVARQFESFNRMSTFIVHDLKNLVSQLSLMMTNAEKHKNNLEFQRDMLDTVEHSIQKMKILLHKLSRGSSIESPVPLSIHRLLQQAVVAKSAFEPKPLLQIQREDMIVFANWSRLERIVGHIIQNAIEATPKDGIVLIRLFKQDSCAVIEFEDDGQGMSEEFIRERLFRPFESTKSAGMGIGVFETREYVHEIGGKLEVISSPSVGTTFRMVLPLHGEDAQTLLVAV